MHLEQYSEFEGPALPIFPLIPGGRSFWTTRIFLEPVAVYILASLLQGLGIFQSGLTTFLHILMQHLPSPRRHGMRYFGLLAPRSIRMFAAVFVVLGQKRRPKPTRLDWASLRLKCFGKDPLIDDRGEWMSWVGQLRPQAA